MSTTEESVQVPSSAPTETPAAPVANTGKSAFAAARASLRSETTDKPSQETPVEEPSKVEDQPQAATDDTDSLWTPDELAKLTKQQQELVRKMQGDYTRKTQKLSAERKELEADIAFVKSLRENPDTVLEHLAKQRGFTLARESAETATSEETPADLKFLEPWLEAREKRLEAKIRAEYEPVQKGVQELVTAAAAKETESTLKAFAASHPGWEKHEQAMIEVGKKFLPTGDMTDDEYMEALHTLVTAKESEAEKTKKVVEKINKAVERSEQKVAGMSSERVEHVMPPPGKRGIREAFAAAKRGEVWTK